MIFLFATSFSPILLRFIISLLLEASQKISKIGLEIGAIIGGADTKSGNNTHFLVIMCVKLTQKIGLHNLTNWT